jgi:hypothetical protein
VGCEQVEKRVAFVEGRVSEHGRMIELLRQSLVSLEQRIDQRFAAVDQRFVAIDQRFAAVDQRLAALDDKMSRHFTWLVGLQVTTLIGGLGALLARP